MSASAPRVQRGGGASRGTRGSNPTARSARGSFRGSMTSPPRGRGRGRGVSNPSDTASSGEGLLQKLRSGTVQRGSEDGATPGGRGRGAPRASLSATTRGRGHYSKNFNALGQSSSAPVSRTSSPAPSSMRDFLNDATARHQLLKQQREVERAQAIKNGLLADPEKKTTLDKAITTVGTCIEMCPEFERVERVVQKMVDNSEKIKDEDTGRDIPSEPIMVKRFRRSAAGYDEQLPSDIRTPEALKRTLDYLVDSVIGGPERLAVAHKFVWDRTRAIRNDFSIQQVSKEEDVYIAVDCFERIARFHILSLHQLSSPENLLKDEDFNDHQEREQLNNTLLSLMYYYDDNRDTMVFPNEAEFRAYCIIFEIQAPTPDLEDRMQSWPSEMLSDKRVETAFRLYQAAGNTLSEEGPLEPKIPVAIAQNNTGSFWTVLSASTVPYIMACVAEIYFPYVRFAALDAVWKSGKQAPQAHQARSQDWNLEALTECLGFDDDQQTVDFCNSFDLDFNSNDSGVSFLNFSSHSSSSLDKSRLSRKQIFSHTYVEEKRCRRSFVAIINGLTVADAIREGSVEASDDEHEIQVDEVQDDGQSFFIPETNNISTAFPQSTSNFGAGLNPQAPTFSMTKTSGQNVDPSISNVFGNNSAPSFSKKFGEITPGTSTTFGQPSTSSTIFGQPATSIADTAKSASSTLFAHSQAQMSNPPSQETGLGKAAFPSPTFDFKSAFTPPAEVPTTPSESKPSSFTGFNFTKPAEPSPPKSGTPVGGFQFAKPGAPASVSTTFQPPPTAPSFDFKPSSSDQLFGPPQSALSAFPAAAPSKEQIPSFVFGAISQNPLPAPDHITSYSNTEEPAFQSAPESAAPKPPSQFGPAAKFQAPESPISPKTIPPPASVQQHQAPETPSPSIPTFNFTPSQPEPAEQARIGPQPQVLQPPKRKTSVPSVPSPLSFSQTVEQGASPAVQSTTPPASPRQQSEAVYSTAPNKSQLIHHLAYLSLCQPDGLLQEYLEYTLPRMLKGIVKQHNDWVRQTTLDRIKKLYLQRKYGGLWKKLAWRNVLNRKANVRRKKFTELLGKEAEKRRRLEHEKDEIIKAVEEKKRLQAEMAEMKKVQELEAKKKADVKNATGVIRNGQLAGKKRKSLDDNPTREATNTSNATPSYRNHKRSRTMGSAMPPPPKPQQPSPQPSSNEFRFSRSGLATSLSRSSSGRAFGRSSYRPPQDTTQTDFFRLLAHGVDPETPWIPLTAAQVAVKEKKEKEERDANMEAAYNRRRVGDVAKKATTRASESPAEESPIAAPSSSAASTPVSTYDPESDELLQQLRAARQQLAEETDWLKGHNEQRQKEIEQEEKLKSSASSSRSFRMSSNGLPMANGYEYFPTPNVNEGSMSRVERRIRATGARGLAYKPFGDYKPAQSAVPMSRKTARKYLQPQEEVEDIKTNGVARKRRKHGTIDHSYRPSGDDQLTDEEQELEEQAYQALKQPGVKHAPPVAMSAKAAGKQPASMKVAKNPFDRLQNTQQEVEDYDESVNEEDEDAQHLYYHNGEDGDTEEIDDEDGEEEEAEEEDLLEDSEDELEDDEYDEDHLFDDHHLRATSRPYSDAPTPNTQVSHVSSGIGATAEDPLELSD